MRVGPQAHTGLENQTMPAPNTRKLPSALARMEVDVLPVEGVGKARKMRGDMLGGAREPRHERVQVLSFEAQQSTTWDTWGCSCVNPPTHTWGFYPRMDHLQVAHQLEKPELKKKMS